MMRSLSQGTLVIEVNASGDDVVVNWRGRSEERDPNAVIAPFLSELRTSMDASRAVVLDFRGLDYMNSSTVRPIVSFLKEASQAAREVRVVYDGQRNWQRLSFRAVQSLAAMFGNVRFEGSA